MAIPGRARVGVLRQDRFLDDAQIILDLAMMGDAAVWRALVERNGIIDHGAGDAARLADLEETLKHLDGYTLEARATAVLEGLGIPFASHKRSLSTLSGGSNCASCSRRCSSAAPTRCSSMSRPTTWTSCPSAGWRNSSPLTAAWRSSSPTTSASSTTSPRTSSTSTTGRSTSTRATSRRSSRRRRRRAVAKRRPSHAPRRSSRTSVRSWSDSEPKRRRPSKRRVASSRSSASRSRSSRPPRAARRSFASIPPARAARTSSKSPGSRSRTARSACSRTSL